MTGPRILVIRRDNIGDLVCTTPMIRSLRQHHPEACIDALVNTYNAPVLERNPDLDAVHIYRKAKHRESGQNPLRLYAERLALLWRLRRRRYDYAILAGSGFQRHALRTAGLIRPRHIIGYVHEQDYRGPIDRPVWRDPGEQAHEVRVVQRLLGPLDIHDPPPALCLVPDGAAVAAASEQLRRDGWHGAPVAGLHISARVPGQRWPAEKFAALARALHQRHGCDLLLFWSPGPEHHPQHPGDDDKARRILEACSDLPLRPWPTLRLQDLITGLALCDRVVCSDGGAMHLAAGLGKPLVCFFGAEGAPDRWHPWQVPHVLLHSAPQPVAALALEQVLAAWDRLGPVTALSA